MIGVPLLHYERSDPRGEAYSGSIDRLMPLLHRSQSQSMLTALKYLLFLSCGRNTKAWFEAISSEGTEGARETRGKVKHVAKSDFLFPTRLFLRSPEMKRVSIRRLRAWGKARRR